MQPSDKLSFSQDFLPLEEEIARYGEATPSDVAKIQLCDLSINDKQLKKSEWEQTESLFAPTLIRNLDNKQKLKAPSFENMKAGFLLTASYDMKNDSGTLSESEYELDHDDIDWVNWQSYADTVLPTITPHSMQIILGNITNFNFNSKLERIPFTRASMRRTDMGFKRNIFAMELRLHQKMDKLIEQLDDTNL